MVSSTKKTVLFVDDDADVRKTADLLLRKHNYAVIGAADPQEALSILAANPVDVILLDLNFTQAQTSGREGLACLRDILALDPKASVIIVTGHSGLNIAVQALRNGASDFIMKPWNNTRLVDAVAQALATNREMEPGQAAPPIIVGTSEPIRKAKATIDRCAPLTASVLFRGETGTGKTLAALNLHQQSGRANLKHIDASALTPADLDDAPNASLILENIDRLSESMVPALLSWMARAQRHNGRLITTTGRLGSDLGLDKGLTYALRTVEIVLPPLRDRAEDILPIAEHFVRVVCQQQGFTGKSLSRNAQALLQSNAWTDNVHALRHAIERAIILTDGESIEADDLAPGLAAESATEPVKASLAISEKALIEDALKRCHFNVSAAAEALGLSRPSLYRRMSKHGL